VRVAALYDIHGNLPALDAVLTDVEAGAFDVVLVGGDVAAGPMPAEVLDRLSGLDLPVRWVMGNGDRELVAAFDAGLRFEDVEGVRRLWVWAAGRLTSAHRDLLASFEPTVRLDVDGLGPTLFCHGSPRRDDEIITAVTAEGRLREILAGVAEDVVVCGHTHNQFDRTVAGRRVLNAGSIGMPYQGAAAAFWLELGRDAVLRCTDYDIAEAVATLCATGFDGLEETMLRESLLEPVGADEAARHFEDRALGLASPQD
jgi:predicted phosphodiesterase